MIEIRPDPKHPLGGFAEITISGAAAEGEPVMVSVFNSYQQKWLSPDGWQANKTTIAAREVSQSDGNLRLIVGPDIVNQIEEDTPIRIEIGDGSWDTYWPDDINAGPDEAIIGGIGGTGAAPETKTPTVMVAQPEADNDASVLSATDADDGDLSDEADEDTNGVDDEETGKKSMTGLLIGAAVLALLLAGGAYFFLFSGDEPADIAVVESEPKPAPEPAPVGDACAVDQVAALSSEGFGAVATKIRDCGNALTLTTRWVLSKRPPIRVMQRRCRCSDRSMTRPSPTT